VGRLLNGIGHHGCLCLFIYSVFNIGSAAALIDEGIDPTIFNGVLIAVEGVTGRPLIRQALATLPNSSDRIHNPILCLMMVLAPSSKPATLTFSSAVSDQI
jgi:hypothetical protein